VFLQIEFRQLVVLLTLSERKVLQQTGSHSARGQLFRRVHLLQRVNPRPAIAR